MREPPDLAGEAIVEALRTGFGIRVAGLSFLPVGNDADSWPFRVEAADGPDRFLKVRSGTGAMPGAAVPAYLHRRGTPGSWRLSRPGPASPTWSWTGSRSPSTPCWTAATAPRPA